MQKKKASLRYVYALYIAVDCGGVSVCVCVCVCVRERAHKYTQTHEKERERESSFSHTYTPHFNIYAQTHTRKREHPCNIYSSRVTWCVMLPQVWFEKIPLGKKRKKAAQ